MNITIRRFQEKDIENKIKWINDEKNNQYLHYDLPLEYGKTLDWFNKNKDNPKRYDAVIEVDGALAGLLGLLSIDEKNRKAEFYIIIGDREYRGRGIAKKGTRLLLDYAFNKIDLEKVYLFTEADNTSAQRLFESVGFIREGLLRKDIKNRGILVDRYVYGLCREDYYFKERGTKKPAKMIKMVKMAIIQKLKNNIGGNNIYIMRDDLLPFSFGGNKARKAALFLKDFEDKNKTCLVTYGTSSSNHCRVIANLAASKGIPSYIISPEGKQRETYNRKMTDIFGAKIIYSPLDRIKDTIDKTLDTLMGEGHRPYFIAGGGHGNLGTQAYVDAYQEIREYEKEKGIKFDYLFHPSGTGTTQAGLICGKLLNNDNIVIVGISVGRKNPRGREIILSSIRDYMAYLKAHDNLDNIDYKLSNIIEGEINPDQVNFIDDYVLSGYGDYNNKIIKTIKGLLVKEGIPLDRTYTGKAFWGMEEYIEKNRLREKNILFLHTGALPLFFNDLEDLLDG